MINTWILKNWVRICQIYRIYKEGTMNISNLLNEDAPVMMSTVAKIALAATNVSNGDTQQIINTHTKKNAQQNSNNYLYIQPKTRSSSTHFDLSNLNSVKLVLNQTEQEKTIRIFHEHSQLYYFLSNESVPVFIIDNIEDFKYTPIQFYEKVKDLGNKYGLVKLHFNKCPYITDKLIKNVSINNEQFWFKTKRQALNSYFNESIKILNFHKDLFEFEKFIKKQNLTKIPNIDKRKLDLYRLRNCVQIRGGFHAVCSKKLWAQIGRELGYSGRIMSSLSTSLRSAYAKVLLDFDNYQEKQKLKKQSTLTNHITEKHQFINHNKRTFFPDVNESDSINNYNKKKAKLENTLINQIHQISSSTVEFPRLRDLNYSKGIFSNFDQLTEVKKNLTTPSNLTLPSYDFTFWQDSQEIYDKSIFETKSSSVYSLKQYYDKSQRNLEKLQSYFPQSFEDILNVEEELSEVNESQFEKLLSELLSSESIEYEIDAGIGISPMIHNSDYLLSTKSDKNESNAFPWSLPNIPLSKESLLRFLDLDLGNNTRSKLDIGMLFSTNGWSVNDSFLPSVDYNHIGSSKLWYVVAPEDLEKLETLIESINKDGNFIKNNTDENMIDRISSDFKSSEFYKCYVEVNSIHSNTKPKRINFHSLLKSDLLKTSKNKSLPNDLYFSPEFLNSHGVNVLRVTQDPGSYVFKYPKAYTSNFGTGFYVSEASSFAPNSWIELSHEGTNWLAERNLLPSINVSQLLATSYLHINDYQSKSILKHILVPFVNEELSNRQLFRNKLLPNNEFVNKFDYISDFSLYPTGFSKVVISSTTDCINISLSEYLKYSNNDNNKISILNENSGHVTVSLHVYYDDEILHSILGDSQTITIMDKSKMESQEIQFKKGLEVLINQKFKDKKIPFIEFKSFICNFDTNIIRKAGVLEFVNGIQTLLKESQIMLSEISDFVDDSEPIYYGKGFSLEYLPIRNDDLLIERLQDLVIKLDGCSVIFPDMASIFHIWEESLTLVSHSLNAIESQNLGELKDAYSRSLKVPLRESIKTEITHQIYRKEWLEVYEDHFNKGINQLSGGYTLSTLISFFNFGLEYCKTDSLEQLSLLKTKILKAYDINTSLSKMFKIKKQPSKLSFSVLENINKTIQEEILPVDEALVELLASVIDGVSGVKADLKPLNDLLNVDEEEQNKVVSYIQNDSIKCVELLQKYNGSNFDIRIPSAKLSSLKLLTKYIKTVKIWTSEVNRFCNKKIEKRKETIERSLDYEKDHYVENINFQADDRAYCFCRQGDFGSVMVECELCKEWYHKSCINEGRWELPNSLKNVFVCSLCNLDNIDEIFSDSNLIKYEQIKKLIISGVNLKLLPDPSLLMMIFDIYICMLKFRAYISDKLFDDGNIMQSISISKLRYFLRKILGSKCDFGKAFMQPILKQYSSLTTDNFKALENSDLKIVTGYSTHIIEQELPSNTLLATISDANTPQQILSTFEIVSVSSQKDDITSQ